jgi:hypothetical protein
MTVWKRREQVSQSKLRFMSKITLGAAALVLTSSPATFADELKVLDLQGKTRSAVEMSDGTSASVRVSLISASQKENVKVSLIDTHSNNVIQTVLTGPGGIAMFENISTGTFKVSVDNKLANPKIANISILQNNNAQHGSLGSSESEKRSHAKAMYLGGASAVAGAVGIALGTSGGSSSDTSDVSFLDTDTSGVNNGGAGSSEGGSLVTNGDVSVTADTEAAFGGPNLGPTSPAPGTTTQLTPPSNSVGSGNEVTDPTDNPPAPTPSPAPNLSGS